MYSSDELFQHWRKDYFGANLPSLESTREIKNETTLELA